MKHRIEDILEECLEQLLQGKDVQQCLQLHSGKQAQLDGLLQLAAAVRRASCAVGPRAEFKAQTGHRIREVLSLKKHESLNCMGPP